MNIAARNLAPIPLGDMVVFGRPPAKLLKALAIIAADLHPAFNAREGMMPDKSKISCILASLAVRDFLLKIGLADARCEPCWITIYGFRNGADAPPFHSVGITPESRGPGWTGHLVAAAQGFLIDPTFYQFQRPCWPEIPGMLAVPIADLHRRSLGFDFHDGERRLEITYAAAPENRSWKAAPDAHKDRRRAVVNALIDAMKGWRE